MNALKPILFQFTPLREGRLRKAGGLESVYNISIHAPPRGATEPCPLFWREYEYFNSRPSARGDHSSRQTATATLFQFTPLREGRHQGIQPVRRGYISIHAPPRGATRHSRQPLSTTGYFNSRPSARGDMIGAICFLSLFISIHAPPRGATGGVIKNIPTKEIFQFTPLREGRP